MPDKEVRPEPGEDVVVIAPAGYRFETPGWRNGGPTGHTRMRLPGAVVADPAHNHPAPPPPPPPDPDPEPEPEPEPPPPAGQGEILISKADLMKLPTSGTAWNAVVAAANSLGPVNVGDQNETDDVRLLAAALVAVRTGGSTATIRSSLAAIPSVPDGGALALARNVMPVVLAADLIGYREPAFVNWVSQIRSKVVSGRSLISTHEDRPNNWGTHAGASRIAADLFLGDQTDLDKAIKVFRGWLGDRSQYAGFDWGDLSWQADKANPVGVNAAGAKISGNNVDGVLPDDQRRAGGYTWPPPKENYVYEGLQGALMQAELLYRAGYPSYGWSNAAIARAYKWLHEVNQFPAEGDDSWQPWIVNARLGTKYPAKSPTQMGKNFGFADWLYGG